MKKYILVIPLLLASVSIFARAAGEPAADSAEEPVVVRFVTPAGFTAISLAEMIADNPKFDGKISVEYEVVDSPDLIAGKILSGEADMMLAPTNLGGQLCTTKARTSFWPAR